MEQDFLTKVSFLIPVISRAWPWIARLGMCLATLHGLGGCLVRIYLAYQMKGFGVWLIPTALGILITLIIIPITILQRIWADLATGRIPGTAAEGDPKDNDRCGPTPAPRVHEPPMYAWRALHNQLDQLGEPP